MNPEEQPRSSQSDFENATLKVRRRPLSQAAVVVVSGMLVGRVLGLLRELTLSANLGVSREADLAALAITVPDLLNTLAIGGAMSAVLIPEFYRRVDEAGDREGQRFVAQCATLVCVCSVVAAAVLAVGASWLAGVLAPGLTGADHDQAVGLLRVVLIGFPFCTIAAVYSAALQAQHRVFAPAFTNVVFNTLTIAGIATAAVYGGLFWVALGVLLATVGRLGLVIAGAVQAGLLTGCWLRVWSFDLLDRALLVRYLQAWGAIGLAVLIPVIGRGAASYAEGGIAAFNYSFKLIELPIGILGAVLTMVLFPRISRAFAAHDRNEIREIVGVGTAVLLTVTVSAMTGFLPCSRDVVALLFGRGQIGEADLALLTAMSQIGFLALPAYALSIHARGLYYAVHDTRTPLLVSMSVVPCLVGFVSVGMWRWGILGVMGAIVASHWLNLALLYAGLTRKYRISLLPRVKRWHFGSLVFVNATTLVGAQWAGGVLETWPLRLLGAGCLFGCAASCTMIGLRSELSPLWGRWPRMHGNGAMLDRDDDQSSPVRRAA